MKSITLKRPIEHEGKTYASLDLDEPTVGAIEAFEKARVSDGNEFSASLSLISYDTGIPLEALRKMRSSDYKEVSDALSPFMNTVAAGLNGEASAPK